MMDALHRILSGSTLHRKELIAAGIFVMIWFAIDIIQFSDWLILKIVSAPVICSSVGYLE